MLLFLVASQYNKYSYRNTLDGIPASTIVNSRDWEHFPTVLICLINRIEPPTGQGSGAYQRVKQHEASVQGADERGFVVSGIKSAGFLKTIFNYIIYYSIT